MTHNCADWMKASKCEICQARLHLVNVLRFLRGWEQVLEGVYTGDQVAFELERLLEGYGKELGRDSSPLEAPTVTVNLYGRKVTVQVIPAYTRAGLARVARLCRAARDIYALEYQIACISDGDRLMFWRILVGRVPDCMQFVDMFLLWLNNARIEDDGADDYRPTTPLPLTPNPNTSITVQQLHDLPAGPFNPAAPWRSLAEAELASESEPDIVETSQVLHPPPQPPRHVVAAPLVAMPVPPVADTERAVSGRKSVVESRRGGNPTTALGSLALLSPPKRPIAGATRMEMSRRKTADTMPNAAMVVLPVATTGRPVAGTKRVEKARGSGELTTAAVTPQTDRKLKLVAQPMRKPETQLIREPKTQTQPKAQAQAERPIAGQGRMTKAAETAARKAAERAARKVAECEAALDSKVDQPTRMTEKSKINGRLKMDPFRCFFCGWSGTKEIVRTDQPHNHRVGHSNSECVVFPRLGGIDNPFKIASFLVTRWPELWDRAFNDDQITKTLDDVLKEHHGRLAPLSTKLSKKALQALETYRRTGETPSASSGYADPELE